MKLLILGTVLLLVAINLISADSAESTEHSIESLVSSEELSDEASNRPARGPKGKRPEFKPQRDEDGGREPLGPRKGRKGGERLPKPEGVNGEEPRELGKVGSRRPRAVKPKAKAVIPKTIRSRYNSEEGGSEEAFAPW